MKSKRMIQTIQLNLQRGALRRGMYLKNVCAEVGENVRFQPRLVPLYPQLIKLHNNIMIGAGVRFVTHDAIHTVLNGLNAGRFNEMIGCIEVMDNVFIGANTTIMMNVKIGNNVIIGANSLVNKDCEPNSIYAGIPAKKVGNFDEFMNKRKEGKYPFVSRNQFISDEEIENAWDCFYKNK